MAITITHRPHQVEPLNNDNMYFSCKEDTTEEFYFSIIITVLSEVRVFKRTPINKGIKMNLTSIINDLVESDINNPFQSKITKQPLDGNYKVSITSKRLDESNLNNSSFTGSYFIAVNDLDNSLSDNYIVQTGSETTPLNRGYDQEITVPYHNGKKTVSYLINGLPIGDLTFTSYEYSGRKIKTKTVSYQETSLGVYTLDISPSFFRSIGLLLNTKGCYVIISSPTSTIKPLKINIVPDDKRFDVYTAVWINRSGGTDTYNFNLAEDQKYKKKDVIYRTNHTQSNIISDVNKELTLRTKYLNDGESDNFKEIFFSPSIYIIKDGRLIEYFIDDKSIEYKKNGRGKLIAYELTFIPSNVLRLISK